MRLSKRISLVTGALLFAVAAGVGTIAFLPAKGAAEDAMYQALGDRALAGAELVESIVDKELDVLQELANYPQVRSMDWDLQRAALRLAVERLGFLDMAVVTPDGKARYIIGGTVAELGDRDYVKNAFGGRAGVSDVLVSRVIQKPVLMYAVPIADETGRVLGALIGRKDATTLGGYTKDRRASGETGFYFMVNDTGVITSHPDESLVLDQFNPVTEGAANKDYASLGQALSKALDADGGVALYQFQGRMMVASFTQIPGLPWKIFVAVEKQEFMRGINRLVLFIALAGVLFVVIGIVLAAILGRSIATPIVRVANTLKEISEGEGDLTSYVDAITNDEVGELANHFNRMMDKIKNLVMIIKNQAAALSDIGTDLSNNMGQTASAINEITATIQNVKGQGENISGSVAETNSSVEHISANINKLNGQIEKQAASVGQSTSAIQEMLANTHEVAKTLVQNEQNISRLMDASEIGRNGLREVAANIQEIARESDGLLEINAVMQSIASQTNFLSMNAAIEAAHAEGAGRGFAVVAGEVRKLAESSSKQSKTISDVLKRIVASIRKISDSTENVLNRFEAIDTEIKTVTTQEEHIRNAMEEQSSGSRQILESVTQVNEITGAVKAGAAEMIEESERIKSEGKRLESLSSEIAGGMTEMAIGADRINSAVTNVNTISGQNKENIDILSQEVSRFKVEETIKQYRWDDSLSVGHELIDSQHQELFAKLNMLLRAIGTGKGAKELKFASDFLSDYTIKHFFEEEQIQKKYRYPDYENHHKMHEYFKGVVREFSRDLIMKGPTNEMVGRVDEKLAGWLINHIKTQDVKVGAFVKGKGK
jgi:methyl-accepting chemotaxis protein